jgi:hypothetical protein
MSRQMLISVGILILTFASGVASGLFLGSGAPSASGDSEKATGTAASSLSPTAEGRERIEANTLLSDRIQELEKELADQKNDRAAILADRLAFVKKFPNQLGISSFGEDLKVTPAMAEFLKLSPQEQEALEQHLAQIQGEIKKIEQAKITLVKQDDNSVTYEIPAYPEGKALKDQLNSLVTADIGDERASVFLGDSKWEFNEAFSGFGEGKTDIQITQTDQNKDLPYLLKETYANGSGSERPIGNSLPERYQDLIQLNPAPGP